MKMSISLLSILAITSTTALAAKDVRKVIRASITEICVYSAVTDTGLFSGADFEPQLNAKNAVPSYLAGQAWRDATVESDHFSLAPGQCEKRASVLYNSLITFTLDSQDPFTQSYDLQVMEDGLLRDGWKSGTVIKVVIPDYAIKETTDSPVVRINELPKLINFKTDWGYGKIFITEDK